MAALSRTKSSERESARAQTPGAFWKANLRCPGFLSMVLLFVTFSVFLPVVSHEFVNYDDPDYVTANPHVQSGLKWENVIWAFTTGHASNWHPLTWLSHMLDCQLFGQHPGAQHLTNAGFQTVWAYSKYVGQRGSRGGNTLHASRYYALTLLFFACG